MKKFLAAFLLVLAGCFGADYAPELIARAGAAFEGDAGAGPELDVTGATCTDAALDAALNPPRDPAPPLLRLVVELPTGAKLRLCNGPVHMRAPIRLRANGARIFAHPSTGLPDMLVCDKSAERSLIEDLELRYILSAPSLVDNAATALDVNCAQFGLQDSYIRGAGVGVKLDATGPGDNLNWPYFSNNTIVDSRRAGLRIRGTDASGGTFVGLRIFSSKDHFTPDNAVSLEESSGNGNTYLGLLVEYSDVGIRVNPAGGMAPSTFVGGYIEEGDPTEWLGTYSGNTTTIGGHLSKRDAVKGDRIGMGNSILRFSSLSASGVRYAVTIPGADANSFMHMARNAQAYDRWLLKPIGAVPTSAAGVAEIGWQHYMSQNLTPLSLRAVTTPQSSEVRFKGQTLCGAVMSCP